MQTDSALYISLAKLLTPLAGPENGQLESVLRKERRPATAINRSPFDSKYCVQNSTQVPSFQSLTSFSPASRQDFGPPVLSQARSIGQIVAQIEQQAADDFGLLRWCGACRECPAFLQQVGQHGRSINLIQGADRKPDPALLRICSRAYLVS